MLDLLKALHNTANKLQSTSGINQALGLFVNPSALNSIVICADSGQAWQIIVQRKNFLNCLFLLLTGKLNSLYIVKAEKLD